MDFVFSSILIWVGIVACLCGSALCSGLTLGYFSLSRIHLETLTDQGNQSAGIILGLRKDANFLLATLLWSNVAVNVLLTLLTDSQMHGIMAFMFSVFGITLLGEILPQAYFSRNALKLGARLTSYVKFLQIVFFVFAKPSALLLDRIVGKEGVTWFEEKELKALLNLHTKAPETDIGNVEGRGAANFLSLDDVSCLDEGSPLNPLSVVQLTPNAESGIFPKTVTDIQDNLVEQIHQSGQKWVVITSPSSNPQFVLDADSFLRELLVEKKYRPYYHCHRPIVVTDPTSRLDQLLPRLKVKPEHAEDDVIDHDIILIWTDTHKRIITGADILGRLLRGIVRRDEKIVPLP
ncbi:MAG: CNNM domain-containing protein [Nitrospirales bacterium]|nr:CNNM domain-containing protein [Nitrospirales bacterium]